MYSNRMRMTGMFSGMDTEAMVKQLMNAESMRYNKLKQTRQKAEWRQAAYRSVAGTLKTFQDSYLTSDKAGSFYRDATFNSLVSKITDKNGGETSAVKVSIPSISAPAGDIKFTVHSVAERDAYLGKARDQAITGESVGNLAPADKLAVGDSFTVSLSGGAVATFTMTEDDMDQLAAVEADIDDYNDRVAELINIKLRERFGNVYESNGAPNPIPVSGSDDYLNFDKAKVKLTYNTADKTFSLEAAAGYSAVIGSGPIDSTDAANPNDNNALKSLGLKGKNGSNTNFDRSQKMGAFLPDTFAFDKEEKDADDNTVKYAVMKINGKEIKVYEDDSISDFEKKVNASGAGVTLSYDTYHAAFKLESKAVGKGAEIKGIDVNGKEVLDKLGLTVEGDTSKGEGTIDAAVGVDGPYDSGNVQRISEAKDTVITYNGVTYSRESTKLDIDGITVTLSEGAAEEVGGEPAEYKISITQDVSKPKEAIVKFMEEYNKLIDMLNGQVNTSRPKSDTYTYYEPLTDEEKDALSEKEVEKLEEKAKTGLLYRDDLLSRITSQMRTMMYTEVELSDGSKMGLYSLGITTSSAAKDAGKLVIWDEAKLDAALAANPANVAEIFTKAAVADTSKYKNHSNEYMKTGGLATRLNSIIENAIGRNAPQNSIRHKAGLENTETAFDNDIYKEITGYDDRLKEMMKALQKKEDYYYKMFARMEQAMSESDSQTSSLLASLGQ